MRRIKMFNSGKKDHPLQNFCKGNGSVRIGLVYGYLQMLLLLVSATAFEISETAAWLNNHTMVLTL